jgi:hypothetical protein
MHPCADTLQDFDQFDRYLLQPMSSLRGLYLASRTILTLEDHGVKRKRTQVYFPNKQRRISCGPFSSPSHGTLYNCLLEDELMRRELVQTNFPSFLIRYRRYLCYVAEDTIPPPQLVRYSGPMLPPLREILAPLSVELSPPLYSSYQPKPSAPARGSPKREPKSRSPSKRLPEEPTLSSAWEWVDETEADLTSPKETQMTYRWAAALPTNKRPSITRITFKP